MERLTNREYVEAQARQAAKDDFDAGLSCSPTRHRADESTLFAQWYEDQYKIYIQTTSAYVYRQRLSNLRKQVKLSICEVVRAKGDTSIQGIDYEMSTRYCMGTKVSAVQLQGSYAYLITDGGRASFSAADIEELIHILIHLKED